MRSGGKIIPELFAEGQGCVSATGGRPLSSAAHSRFFIADAAEWPDFPAIGVVPQEPRFCLLS